MGKTARHSQAAAALLPFSLRLALFLPLLSKGQRY